MDKTVLPFMLSHYDEVVTSLICEKYGYAPMEAFSQFLNSETYQMLINIELRMWEISPAGIFDLWESEKITGNPRNSLYIRRN